MSKFFYGSSGDLNTDRIRLGSGFSLTEAAESGLLAMSRVRVDDPSGNLTITGHHEFRAIETACSWQRSFTGYFADRTVKRADSMLTGAARIWDATVYDLNAALQFEIIRGSTARRPAETDTARLAWLLGSGFLGPISTSGSAVFGAGENLDKQDYRGMTAADVLSDCAQASGCNHFVAWDDSLAAPVIHYYLPSRAFNSSTLRISNVLADVDMATVYAPDRDASLERDPSRIFSGVYYQYGDDNAAEYETSAGVLAAIGHKRETTVMDASVKSSTKAARNANTYLAEAATDEDTITVSIAKVRPADVNLIRAGQRIEVKLSHLPGYSSFTWMRVQRRTISDDGETQEFYRLDLQLSNPKQGGTKNRHRPNGGPDGEVDIAAGSSVAVTLKQASRGTGKALAAYAYAVAGSTVIRSAVSPNTAYTVCGCPLGAGGWGPGTGEYAAWYEFTPTLGSDDVGVLLTWPAATGVLGIADDVPFLVCWSDGQPASWGDWTPVGQLSDAGGTFLAPRSLLTSGAVNYVGLVPSWQADADAFFCAQDLVDGAGGPVIGGEGASGAANAPAGTATLATLSGTGWSPWVSGIGTVDGSNRVYTLVGWSGYGRVSGTINGTVLPDDGMTLDGDAGTVTLDAAPGTGDVVLFRYRMAVNA